ncbi:hypothetical protein [Peribacillus frigoritolerans]|uniref:hypothetical protein n=1 Tax=Peribacillus frigoritolerans TaxID=450367 RepID=UPI00207A092D|nr:hypothetical protein [Peribacillus frigoritolerans]USK63649.1 hypothetical protein LIT26_20875 [Peribacillus frigoritolerans]
MFFSVVVIGLKKCAALLPNYWLAEPPQPLFDVAWQTVGGKGADSEINCNVFNKTAEFATGCFFL